MSVPWGKLDLPKLFAHEPGNYNAILQTSDRAAAERKYNEYKKHGWKVYIRKVGDVNYVIVRTYL